MTFAVFFEPMDFHHIFVLLAFHLQEQTKVLASKSMRLYGLHHLKDAKSSAIFTTNLANKPSPGVYLH